MEPSMTLDQLYDHITSQMTPEVALKRMLGSQLEVYENLKNVRPDEIEDGATVNPLFIITAAAMDLGWNLAIEKGDEGFDVEGLTVGTEAYMKRTFGH